ncbi:MAG: cupin domain-containing protein [Pseudomonadota bacterium]
MAESTKSVIARLGLTPHPFEGWFAEVKHQVGHSRRFVLLLAAGGHVPWHRLPAQITWRYQEGSPLVLSQSVNGLYAEAVQLGPQGEGKWMIPANNFQTLETVGRWTVIEGTLAPDIPISERIHCRDNWYPGSS